jgi:DNA primase
MSVVDEIKSRVDIVDVASDYVPLQKAGRNFKARCPFHTEKTPSFTVNPDRQAWHCFGACATGGDVFSLVMRAERLDFGETLKLLAQRTGVTLSQERQGGRSDILYRINQEAVRFYQKALSSPEGRRGMEYLAERGVDADAISTFQLGLSLRGRDRLKGHLRGLGFDTRQLLETGLLHRGEDGETRDFFWGRLMFPIHDRQGRVSGFGARSMDGSDPKYLNTAATPVFDKRATVYGLHMAAASIREQRTVVIVEGYMDAITAHQYGYKNVVASMGTALTEQQVSQLKSIARMFVQAMDPDAAGQEATLRSLESTYRVLKRQLGQSAEFELKIAELPAGRDPDDLIREDQGEWERLVREALSFVDFALPAFAARYDLSTAQGKAQAAETLLPLVTTTTNSFEQERYFQRLAQVLGVSREALEASIGRPKAASYNRGGSARGRGPARVASVSPLMSQREDFLEDYVLALLLGWPELRERAGSVSPAQFHRTENREVFTHWLGCSTIDELQDVLDDTLRKHLAYLGQIDISPADRGSAETALGQSLGRLEQSHLREMQEGLLASDDATSPPSRELEETIVSVNSRLKELFTQR